jgi:hypothetical protein
MRKDGARRREPVKLVRRHGQWSLEFNRLVAVDDQIMRPERHHVAATTDALRSLAPSCPPTRLRDAETLMQQPDDGSERAFELGDEGWVPLSTVANSQRPLSRSEMMAVIAELQTQLTLMRGLHDALLGRVVAMEAALQAKPASEPEPMLRPVRRVPSRRDMLAELLRPEQVGAEVPRPAETTSAAHAPTALAEAPPPYRPSPHPGPARQPATSRTAPPLALDATAAAAVDPVQAPTRGPRIDLPAPAEVIECLNMLASDVALTAAPSALPADLDDYYVARLVDAADEALCVILIDQRAGAELGGGLLGLAPAVRDEQARRGIAQDTLEGLHEICNNLGGLVNRRNPKSYTKLRPLERLDRAALPWLDQAATMTLGLATPSNGALWLVAR